MDMISANDMHAYNSIAFQGLANRRTGATSVNMESSRSHCVFTCIVDSQSKVVNCVNNQSSLGDEDFIMMLTD